MTKFVRRTGLLGLVLLLGMFTIVGISPAGAQEADCYPVPPGGCGPTVQADATCDDIIAAIAADEQVTADNTGLDTNGDGSIDEQDLPASCTCAEILDAIAAGTLDAGNLPAGAIAAISTCDCDEIQAAIDAGTLDEGALPGNLSEVLAGCQSTTVAQDAPAPPPLADTGIDAEGLAGLMMAGLLGGLALLAVSRRTA